MTSELRLVESVPASPRAGAPPLLFVHGAGHGAWFWERWLPRFAAAGYRSRALELSGHALPPGTRPTRLRDYLADIDGALADLDERPVLIGHSLGGLLIECVLAVMRLPAAILVAPVPGRWPLQASLKRAVRHPVAAARSIRSGDVGALTAGTRLAREAFFTTETPERVVAASEARLRGEAAELFVEMSWRRPAPPLPGTPTLVLAPERDSLLAVWRQRRLADRLEAELLVAPGLAHAFPLEPRGDEVADGVLAWLDRVLDTPDG